VWRNTPSGRLGVAGIPATTVLSNWCKGLVGVEKLFPAKFAKIKSRQDALQTTFSVFLDIFYPPNCGYFEENGVFPHVVFVN
jgi:hypothetical protein